MNKNGLRFFAGLFLLEIVFWMMMSVFEGTGITGTYGISLLAYILLGVPAIILFRQSLKETSSKLLSVLLILMGLVPTGFLILGVLNF